MGLKYQNGESPDVWVVGALQRKIEKVLLTLKPLILTAIRGFCFANMTNHRYLMMKRGFIGLKHLHRSNNFTI